MSRSEQQTEVWSDEQWQIYVAKLPPILRPKDFQVIPEWMLYRPRAFPRRFDTHFFFTAMPDGQEAAHDQLETTESIWIGPEEALTRFQEGRFPLVFATLRQLQTLCDLGSIAAVRQRFADQPLPTVQPKVIKYGGQQVIVISDRQGNRGTEDA